MLSYGTSFTRDVPGCILIKSWVTIQTIDCPFFIHVPTCVAIVAWNNTGQMLVLSVAALFANRVTVVVLISSWYAWQTTGRTFVLRVLTCITFETWNIARQMLVFSFVTFFTLGRTIGVLISSGYARQTVWQTILCLVLSFHTLRTGIGMCWPNVDILFTFGASQTKCTVKTKRKTLINNNVVFYCWINWRMCSYLLIAPCVLLYLPGEHNWHELLPE